LIGGEAGIGKTFLAASLLEALRERHLDQADAWRTGFIDPRESRLYRLGRTATCIIIKHPELYQSAFIEFLRNLAARRSEHRLRVLVVTRETPIAWQPALDACGAAVWFADPLELKGLDAGAGFSLFQAVQARAATIFHRNKNRHVHVTRAAFEQWWQQSALNTRPLFILAAAMQTVLSTRALDFSARDILGALVQRDLTQLARQSAATGLDAGSLSRAIAMAALAGGLDAARLTDVAARADDLQLATGSAVLEVLRGIGRLEDDRLPPPRPWTAAAYLVIHVLAERGDKAPEYLWACISADPANATSPPCRG
jgi:hypothetical protein